ncbi:MAG: replication initiation factor domain-containing protein [Oscillospiraceae bacterium]|nr:replication initiation factor domain-containing protein [Oscillospiraceae bacterium]
MIHNRDKKEIIIDWCSFTIKGMTFSDILDAIKLDKLPFKPQKGNRGYQHKLNFCDQIAIQFGGREDMGVWVELNGEGCRTFEAESTMTWDDLFLWLYNTPSSHIARLDVACDDRDGCLDIDVLMESAQAGNYICRARKVRLVSSKNSRQADTANTIYFGGRQSGMIVRIYDEAAEQHVSGPWVRCEMELHNDSAGTFVELCCGDAVGNVYAGALNNYLRFVKPQADDANRSRWPTEVYWENFISSTERITLFTKKDDTYSLEKLEHQVVFQNGNAIAAYTEIFGWEELRNNIKNRTVRRNPKYDDLVTRYKLTHN